LKCNIGIILVKQTKNQDHTSEEDRKKQKNPILEFEGKVEIGRFTTPTVAYKGYYGCFSR